MFPTAVLLRAFAYGPSDGALAGSGPGCIFSGISGRAEADLCFTTEGKEPREVKGLLQGEILTPEQASNPVPCIGRGSLNHWTTWQVPPLSLVEYLYVL